MAFVVRQTVNGGESAISGSRRAAISGASVTVIAHLVCVLTPCGGSASIYCARNTIVAVHFLVKAFARGGIARVGSTFAAIITYHISVVATFNVIARVNGTLLSIVAGDRGEDTSSSNASVVSTNTAIVALDRGEYATLGLIASVNGTGILVITRNWSKVALTRREDTRVIGASGVIIATDRGIGDTLSIAWVTNIWVALVAKARAIDFHGGGTLGAIWNAGVLAVSSARITSSSDTSVSCLAVLGSVCASNSRVARVNCALVSIITSAGDVQVGAARSRGARILGASVLIVAADRGEHASCSVVAGVVGTQVVVSASLPCEYTAGGGVARVISASLAIIAREFSVLASSTLEA